MKNLILLSVFFLLISCSSIRVYTDHDTAVDFSKYQTYAYFKPQIDEVEISDLDKRRILKAIDQEMTLKGLTKSETPDLLISFNTKAKEKIYINNFNHWGWGWGWNPWFWGPNYNNVSRRTEGTLYIDVVDATNRQLIWQGRGEGGISEYTPNRDERIALFVGEIVAQYPPTNPN